MNDGSPTAVTAEPPPQQCPRAGDEKGSPGVNKVAVVVISKLGPHDVLMGRGAPAMTHTGNIEFRRLVASRTLDYVRVLRRREKDDIAREIVSTLKNGNGLFLRKIDSSSSKEQLRMDGIPKGGCAWMTVPDEAVLLKVKQALRDGGRSSGPVTVQQQDDEAHKGHRKRSRLLVEAESPTTATAKAMVGRDAPTVNLTVPAGAVAPSYLQKLVADTLQAYQEQCRKRRRWSKNQQILEHHHPNFTHAGCSQLPVVETASTNKASSHGRSAAAGDGDDDDDS
jgi:hypothetical protein